VFRAWTQPVALREWWCPPGWVAGEIDIDLRVGGAYRIGMSRTGTAGAGVSVSGHFLEVRPPERLVYTWRWEGAFAEMPETLVTLDIESKNFTVAKDPRTHAMPKGIEFKLFTAQSDLVNDKVGSIRFFPDGGSNGGRVTIASGERKYEVDVDWLTGRVAILD
jgi:uncharacterized protein YndB with AHSA1/START domain